MFVAETARNSSDYFGPAAHSMLVPDFRGTALSRMIPDTVVQSVELLAPLVGTEAALARRLSRPRSLSRLRR